jgi:DNA-directed RNA polymerase subunit RPC12/RpoP
MVIKCFRCGKVFESPNDKNADYIMAEDTKVEEEVNGKKSPVQKTGIICPECYQPADFVIWGIHKK